MTRGGSSNSMIGAIGISDGGTVFVAASMNGVEVGVDLYLFSGDGGWSRHDGLLLLCKTVPDQSSLGSRPGSPDCLYDLATRIDRRNSARKKTVCSRDSFNSREIRIEF